jgi:hypothetical protein
VRYRLAALSPVLLAAALVAAALASGSPGATLGVYHAAGILAKGLAAAGCLAAAARFGRGDYLRAGWVLFAGCYVLLVAKDLVAGPDPRGVLAAAPSPDRLRDLLVLAANVLSVAGAWLLARVWARAGLSLPGPAARRAGAFAGAAAVALLVAGPALWVDARSALGGRSETLMYVFSDLGDIATFTLTAPFVLTAVALRGGLLGWTWILLAAGNVAWMLVDGMQVFGPSLLPGPAAARLLEEAFRVAACVSYFAAGMAQRWTLSAVAADRA